MHKSESVGENVVHKIEHQIVTKTKRQKKKKNEKLSSSAFFCPSGR